MVVGMFILVVGMFITVVGMFITVVGMFIKVVGMFLKIVGMFFCTEIVWNFLVQEEREKLGMLPWTVNLCSPWICFISQIMLSLKRMPFFGLERPGFCDLRKGSEKISIISMVLPYRFKHFSVRIC